MKKSLILTLLLLALGAWGMVYLHGEVNSVRDAVTLTGETLYGDVSVLEGLTVESRTSSGHYLFWDTVYRPGEEPEIETEFEFTPVRRNEQPEEWHDGVRLEIYNNFSTSTDGSIEDEKLDAYNMGRFFRAVAERTAPGEERIETLAYSDYYDFYPLCATLDLPGLERWWYEGEPTAEMKAVSDFFRIPVIEGHQVMINVGKDATGRIYSYGVSSAEGPEPYLYSLSALTEDTCYFTFDSRTSDGGYVDVSHIPGGYGIYRLPYEAGEDAADTAVEYPLTDTGSSATVHTGELAMVYPLEVGTEVNDLHVNEERGELILSTIEEGKLILTVLALPSMTEKQRLTVMDVPEDGGVWARLYYDDFLTAFTGEELAVVSFSGPEYVLEFTAKRAERDKSGYYMDNSHMDWDGERLAIGGYIDIYGEDAGACDLYLSCYTAEGLQYLGEYKCSLDGGAMIEYRSRCRPMGIDPLTLRWEK